MYLENHFYLVYIHAERINPSIEKSYHIKKQFSIFTELLFLQKKLPPPFCHERIVMLFYHC